MLILGALLWVAAVGGCITGEALLLFLADQVIIFLWISSTWTRYLIYHIPKNILDLPASDTLLSPWWYHIASGTHSRSSFTPCTQQVAGARWVLLSERQEQCRRRNKMYYDVIKPHMLGKNSHVDRECFLKNS